jgi:hypothetical protein
MQLLQTGTEGRVSHHPRHKSVRVYAETKWRLKTIAPAEGKTVAGLLADMADVRYGRLVEAGWLMEGPQRETLEELRTRDGLPAKPWPLPQNREARESVNTTGETKRKLDIIAAVERLPLVHLLHDMTMNRYLLMIRAGRLPGQELPVSP